MTRESSVAGSVGGAACGGCSLQETCSAGARADGPFRGASLVGAAFGYFLFPLVLALAGALLLAGSPALQLVGGAGGLVLGMLVSTRIARRVCVGVQGGSST